MFCGSMPNDPFEKIPVAFVEPLESFLAWLELERGLSKNTLSAYTRDLVQCAAFLLKERAADWQVWSRLKFRLG